MQYQTEDLPNREENDVTVYPLGVRTLGTGGVFRYVDSKGQAAGAVARLPKFTSDQSWAWMCPKALGWVKLSAEAERELYSITREAFISDLNQPPQCSHLETSNQGNAFPFWTILIPVSQIELSCRFLGTPLLRDWPSVGSHQTLQRENDVQRHHLAVGSVKNSFSSNYSRHLFLFNHYLLLTRKIRHAHCKKEERNGGGGVRRGERDRMIFFCLLQFHTFGQRSH